MKKIYGKLILISVTLLMSVSVVVASSYAWFVLSSNPVATGIQVAIAGGNTILIAPDITEEADGVTYHYPGYFSDKMNFSQHESYDYLKDLAGLNPVSTADGVNWFLPTYYNFTDKEVQSGAVLSGSLRPVEDFILDNLLQHGNLPKEKAEEIEMGSYTYLDFWVVAPGGNYTLRISTPTKEGDNSGGSFLVDLQKPVSIGNGAEYMLTEPENIAAAAARVGFLANPIRVTDDSMLRYRQSTYFNENYHSLQGYYYEPGAMAVEESNRFTIYEPNADLHPGATIENGSYVETNPIALIDDKAEEVTVLDRLMVQRTSAWTKNGASTELEQRFQTALMGMDPADKEEEKLQSAFYNDYLQGQISPFVTKGAFVKNTLDLNAFGRSATAREMDTLDYAGATEDVYIIKLERNVPQRIRMFIWLEGQDVDCVDSVRSSNFAVNIEFAGGTE